MSKWHEQAQKKWDEFAEDWNTSSENMWENGSRNSIIPFFSRHVPIGSNILDVACGDGYGSKKLAEGGYQVVATDLSTKMMELANERNQHKNVTYVQGDMMKLPFANQQFDALMVINGIEWTEKPIDAIAELDRVVKKEGFICAAILGPTAHPRKHSFNRLYGEQTIMNTMMPWEFVQLCEEAYGWKLIANEGVMKKGITKELTKQLSWELQMALSFMWLFLFQK
ncbi:class I SAM-dependent methyltransferase [Bacillus kexueae]|uniref:class I SAM-dependent methyltransferase n=1 Tax=Aeribacillus kexueae TaxID=2078952 RepID=UPI001FAEA843|nr:class I SAM-dependent methyltransferase [Bacillus kexueae]